MYEKYEKIKCSGLNIFDIDDISIILGMELPSARVIATRMVKKGVLVRLKRDIYLLKGANVHDFEIANRLMVPSYISFESALNYWGITTQIPTTITSAARRSKRFLINSREFLFNNLPQNLFNIGIVRENTFFIANPEKAFLDIVYYASLGKKSAMFDVLDTGKLSKKTFITYLKYYPDKAANLAKKLIV